MFALDSVWSWNIYEHNFSPFHRIRKLTKFSICINAKFNETFKGTLAPSPTDGMTRLSKRLALKRCCIKSMDVLPWTPLKTIKNGKEQLSIGNHAMLLVQLGINSTSDVWKFCQNWTSRWGESNLANFQTSRITLVT
jgi:hypothetical protein